MGLPTVGAKVGGIPEAVRDGETGLLFEREDVEGLAACLRGLIVDADTRRRLGGNARRHFARRFTLERMVSRTTSVYEDALGRKPVGAPAGTRVPIDTAGPRESDGARSA
jgi:glycosyltransferase involved in cell wall biosynthesis